MDRVVARVLTFGVLQTCGRVVKHQEGHRPALQDWWLPESVGVGLLVVVEGWLGCMIAWDLVLAGRFDKEVLLQQEALSWHVLPCFHSLDGAVTV